MAKAPQLTDVAELIRQLASQEDTQPFEISPSTRIFSKALEGTILVNPPETSQYSAVLDRLIEQFGQAEDISPTSVEQHLQSAIFFALDISKSRCDSSIDERINLAVNELRRTLSCPAQDYECYIPVKGIDPQSLPYRFGPVLFLRFDESQLRKIQRHTGQRKSSKGHVEAFWWQVKHSGL